ncbi:hypothetical protein D3C73_1458670 [compost metagenome]
MIDNSGSIAKDFYTRVFENPDKLIKSSRAQAMIMIAHHGKNRNAGIHNCLSIALHLGQVSGFLSEVPSEENIVWSFFFYQTG